MNTSEGYTIASGGFGAMWSAFVLESLSHMTSWLTVMVAIVFCDLVCGISKSVKLGYKVRFSKAVRDTISKTIVYFSAVVAACMVEVADGSGWGIDKWCCLIVCFIEAASIVSNILQMKGYDIDFNKLVGVMLKKHADIEMEDSDGLLVKRPPMRDKRGRFVKRHK